MNTLSSRTIDLLWLGLLGLLATIPASADPAIYDVQFVSGDPSQIVVMIDTTPWGADAMSRTANLTVAFRTASGGSAQRSYDFLAGNSKPRFLEHGHVYQRAFAVDVGDVAGIQDTRLTFPNDAGKADTPTSASDARRGKTGAATDVIGSATARQPAPALVDMQWYDHTDMAGQDFANMGVGSLQECSDRCLSNGQCRAFTLVTNGSGGGMCWLKSGKPPSSDCSNCVSGVKYHH
jgi:hypothetical protein